MADGAGLPDFNAKGAIPGGTVGGDKRWSMRNPRIRHKEPMMQKPAPKKPALHGAAAESHRQAEAGKGPAKSATSKSPDAGHKTSKASSESESQTRSR